MKQLFITYLLSAICISLPLRLSAQTQEDTLYAFLSNTPVVIDGSADDACWANAQWHAIDQVWIPYNATMNEGDFQGRFKLAWDSLNLFLLAEIIDDSLSDDHSNPLQNWWDDDCLEIFIDEDRSKGNHERNNNAFAYHVSIFYDAIDMNSTGAGVNYKNNIEVVMDTINEDTYIWEVAIKNYNATFSSSNPEASRVILHHNKLMGFSLAYCDNDESLGRENFIGSMYMTSPTANDNYITADYFGSLLLVDPDYVEPTSLKRFSQNESLQIHPNPVNDYLILQWNTAQKQKGKIEIRDLNGKLVINQNYDSDCNSINLGELKEGLYLLNLISDEQFFTKTFIKI